jgi:TPP-dependent indolepyruvate ferredoxin oxidoreductase alpha subunit
VTGYRGSPLGAVDMQMNRAAKQLAQADVKFQEGLNEDLAATALWGAQQAELRGEGKFDGVFGLWYGKGPGVDRSGDAMKHANMAGTSPNGGVLMAMGDDHTGESSTVLHQSEWALVDAYMPIVSPAGVQEILDLGVYGYALSRFSGLWVGLKTMKDTHRVPKPIVVVTRNSPNTSSSLSRMRAVAVSSRFAMARVASNSNSPCSVRIRPRAWRWNRVAFSDSSSPRIWRDTAD